MLGSFNRRQFLQRAAAAVVISQWTFPIFAGDEPDLMSLVDPQLRPRKSTLADSENALPLLREAGRWLKQMPVGDDDVEDCFSAAKADRHRDELIATWLDNNKRAMSLTEQAVHLGKLEFPTLPWDPEISDTTSGRLWSRFLQLWSQRQLARGQSQAAAQTAQLMFDASCLLRNGGGMVIDYLIATVCVNNSLGLMRRIAEDSKTEISIVEVLLKKLPANSDAVTDLQRSLRSEYAYYLFPTLLKTKGLNAANLVGSLIDWKPSLKAIMSRAKYEAARDKIGRLIEGHPKPYDLEDTVKRSSDYFVALIQDCETPWSRQKDLPERKPGGTVDAWPRQLGFSLLNMGNPDEVTDVQLREAHEKLKDVSNPVGRVLLNSTSIGRTTIGAALRNQVHYDGARLILAVCIFARKQHRLPAKLDDLVEAKILPKLPLDPFSAEGFHYSPDEKAIWSVGPEGNVSPKAEMADEYASEGLLMRLDTVPQ